MGQVMTTDGWSNALLRHIKAMSPMITVFFYFFLFLTTFGLLNIVMGVIVEQTLTIAKENDHLIIERQRRRDQARIDILKKLFAEADTSQNGTLDKDEFVNMFQLYETIFADLE